MLVSITVAGNLHEMIQKCIHLGVEKKAVFFLMPIVKHDLLALLW